MNKIFERYRKLNTGEYTYNNGKQEIKNIAIDWDEIRRLVGEETEKMKPKKGIDYFDGKDGFVPIKGIDYFDGKDGVGKDGTTPVKGVDYFTDGDVENLVEKVYRKIEIPEPQTVNIDEIKRQLKNYIKRLFENIEIEPEYVRGLLEELKGDKRLDASAIKGLEKLKSVNYIAGTNSGLKFWGVYDSNPSVRASAGDEYYNSSDELLYKYINNSWTAISGGGEGTPSGADNYIFQNGDNFVYQG